MGVRERGASGSELSDIRVDPGFKRKPVVIGNYNGPCVIKIDETYHLFYANHWGQEIYHATANRITGPYRPGSPILHIDETPCVGHIASPNVHIVDDNLWIYFHGFCPDDREQHTYLWTGSKFYGPLCPFYLHAWRESDQWVGVAKHRGATLYTSADGIKWNRSHTMKAGVRHVCYSCGHFFYSSIGDNPECIKVTRDWKEEHVVLDPVHDWEGSTIQGDPSKAGGLKNPARQLRDPFVFENHLFYSYAGEQGIAVAKLQGL